MMKSLILLGIFTLGALTAPTNYANAEDPILDGCAVGAIGGALLGTVVSRLTHGGGNTRSGDRDKGAIAGLIAGCSSDAAYNDNIQKERIRITDTWNDRDVVIIENSSRYPVKRYTSQRSYRRYNNGQSNVTVKISSDSCSRSLDC